ncbi:nuclear transport factor 2 family protein [Pseudarthrobacter sp. RMG13]|uniref:Nuclear transport factor 2 family protein n=1 Tax=Pseudarthrobacter humi TaxID=2952523 RepID=A0ABT1LL14_9MICC|nr:DUF4440 domain-containing protein [Pseudarthrobacter humi]MCP8999139.1 nuclear transport factor 2 family protein [Pseudarthrobacter humi]
MTATDLEGLHSALCEAMVAGDLAELGVILADDFTLTHMTGSVQDKAEWLDAIKTGQMQYHRIETVEATLNAEGTVPSLTARTLTDATIWGSRATWRLTLRSWFEPRGDGWVNVVPPSSFNPFLLTRGRNPGALRPVAPGAGGDEVLTRPTTNIPGRAAAARTRSSIPRRTSVAAEIPAPDASPMLLQFQGAYRSNNGETPSRADSDGGFEGSGRFYLATSPGTPRSSPRG